jgi:hypothetical protein
MEVPKVNGKNWLTKGLLQVILILAAIAYIAVKEMSPGSGTQNERIARLEECIMTLRPLPTEVAGIRATLDGVKTRVDSIERKLDNQKDRDMAIKAK